MRLMQRLLMRVYGADENEEERRTEATAGRVEARRRERLRMHADATAGAPSAEDFAEWLGLEDPEERNR